jgi:hypothetical protein
MIGSLNILPKGVNLTFDEEDELIRSVVNFLGHRRRNKFAFPLLISLYSFIFATGLTGNLCKLNLNLKRKKKEKSEICFLRYMYYNLEKS